MYVVKDLVIVVTYRDTLEYIQVINLINECLSPVCVLQCFSCMLAFLVNLLPHISHISGLTYGFVLTWSCTTSLVVKCLQLPSLDCNPSPVCNRDATDDRRLHAKDEWQSSDDTDDMRIHAGGGWQSGDVLDDRRLHAVDGWQSGDVSVSHYYY
jgi:hypothetical protein